MTAIHLAVLGAAAGALLAFPAEMLKDLLLRRRSLEIPAVCRFERIGLPLLLAAAGGLLAFRTGLSLRLLYQFLLLLCAAVIALTDAARRVIPNELVLAIIALTAAFGFAGWIPFSIGSSLLGFAGCFLLFLLPALFRGQIGPGDVKLAAAMGFALGLTGSLYAVVAMGVLVLAYTMLSRSVPILQAMQRVIPLGPFLAVALMAVQAF